MALYNFLGMCYGMQEIDVISYLGRSLYYGSVDGLINRGREWTEHAKIDFITADRDILNIYLL